MGHKNVLKTSCSVVGPIPSSEMDERKPQTLAEDGTQLPQGRVTFKKDEFKSPEPENSPKSFFLRR